MTVGAMIHRVTDHGMTRQEIADAIAALRARAVRHSVKDPRRTEIDVEVDRLVDRWVRASE